MVDVSSATAPGVDASLVVRFRAPKEQIDMVSLDLPTRVLRNAVAIYAANGNISIYVVVGS